MSTLLVPLLEPGEGFGRADDTKLKKRKIFRARRGGQPVPAAPSAAGEQRHSWALSAEDLPGWQNTASCLFFEPGGPAIGLFERAVILPEAAKHN